MIICPKCGAQNMDGVSFCGSCGAQMQSYTTPVTPEEPQQQPQQMPYAGNNPANYNRYTPPSNNLMIPPKNYMTEAIIVTIISFLCCCSLISTILGIIAIVKANNVNSEFAKGNYQAANSSAESAKKLTIWAVIVSVAFIVIWIILYVLIFAAIIGEAGGFQEFLNSLN